MLAFTSRRSACLRRRAASAAAASLHRPIVYAAVGKALTAGSSNAQGGRAALRRVAAVAGLGLTLASTQHAVLAAQDVSPGPFDTLTELPEDAKAFLDEIQRAKDRAKRAIDSNDLVAAEQAYLQALAAARKVDQMHTGGELNNLAEICRLQGKYDASAAYFLEAVELMHSVYGENHGLVGFLSHNLGRVRKDQKDWKEARRWYERAAAVRRSTEEAAPLAESLAELSGVCSRLTDLTAAVAAMEECISVSETLPPDQCSVTVVVRRRWQLTQWLLQLERTAHAETTQRNGLQYALERQGQRDTAQHASRTRIDAVQLSQWTLARTLVKLRKDTEAATVFRAAIDAKVAGELQGNSLHRALRPMLNEYRDALVAARLHEQAEEVVIWLGKLKT
jgi:tetratricopeptide (TPR) repeat protein